MARSIHFLFTAAITIILVFFFNSSRIIDAHAILVESTPAIDSTVPGPDVVVKLRFNSRIDHSRSRLSLMLPEGKLVPLKIDDAIAPDTVSAHANDLKTGAYRIRWQVLATDGHITRGDVPFKVS
ncbi:MAG TPA: copper resistance CopC family protein [Blastocatellia bacterium]|nr:copper resistance CopC family protein [Blastocatellia bacterium]